MPGSTTPKPLPGTYCSKILKSTDKHNACLGKCCVKHTTSTKEEAHKEGGGKKENRNLAKGLGPITVHASYGHPSWHNKL